MTTGQRIKEARIKAGVTQAELAKKLGTPYQSVSKWERDERNPRFDTLKRIASALDINISELVDISDISPSLNSAVPLISELDEILKTSERGKPIVLSKKQRDHIKELGELVGKIPNEVLTSDALTAAIKEVYISLFEILNLYGKCLAVRAVENLSKDPELRIK